MRKNMMWPICLCICICVGCVPQQKLEAEMDYDEIRVNADSYFMAGQTLKKRMRKENAETKTSQYIVENENQLIQAIQYEIEQGNMAIPYSCESVINLEKIAEMLSIINPYDVSLRQTRMQSINEDGRIRDEYYEVEVQIMDERYLESVTFAKKKVRELLKQEMTIPQKIRVLHDYIIEQCEYDPDVQNGVKGTTDLFHASGVFFQQKAVCTGYSRAFMVLAQAAHIPVILISNDRINHSWNYVFDGREWRYIDITWDDQGKSKKEEIGTKFLDLSKDEFLKEGTHQMDKDEITYFDSIVENIFFVKYH